MSGFIANGQPTQHASIASDGFWPAIDPAAMMRDYRIGSEVSRDRARAALTHAVVAVNAELDHWRDQMEAVGHAVLADVPAHRVDDESRLIILYRRAVGCAFLAEVAERYRSYDATGAGNQRADDLTPSIDEYRRDLRWAIRDFLGKPRSTVALI
ncbi:MAG: head completion/stabilization protein [Pseudomonadota bacterium]|nr:head completion/stabilization protein [Pseudomonadota bacterium]